MRRDEKINSSHEGERQSINIVEDQATSACSISKTHACFLLGRPLLQLLWPAC